MAATTALTRKTTTSPTAGTLSSESSAPSSSATSGHGISASSALSSSNGNGPRSPSTVVGIALAVVFALALAVAFRLHYSWRRRAARKRNSTFIQYSFYTDAAPGRTSVVPRDEPPLTPPTRLAEAEWDARSTAASSTAATFNSPISASDPDPHHGHDHRPEVRSLDEKLRDIFYPTQAPYPHPCFYPGPRASFAPSFSSPPGSTAPISPPPPVMVQIQTQLPSFVPEPSASPRAWTGPRAPPPRTPGYGGAGEARGVGARPPAYSRH